MVKRISLITLLALAALITVALFTPWLIGETRGQADCLADSGGLSPVLSLGVLLGGGRRSATC